MRRSRILASVVALLMGGFVYSGIALAEESMIIQDFEMGDIALGAWGGLTAELVDDDSEVSMKSLHVYFEEDAEQWCGVTVPLEEFSPDYNTLRFRYKGTASKNTTFFFLIDSGEERYSTSYVDRTDGWTTVEIPLKRFAFDGWQPENAEVNKIKDYPFKQLILQRNGNAKGGNEYYIDEFEVLIK